MVKKVIGGVCAVAAAFFLSAAMLSASPLILAAAQGRYVNYSDYYPRQALEGSIIVALVATAAIALAKWLSPARSVQIFSLAAMAGGILLLLPAAANYARFPSGTPDSLTSLSGLLASVGVLAVGIGTWALNRCHYLSPSGDVASSG